MYTKIVNWISFEVGLESNLKALCYSNFYLIYSLLSSLKSSKRKEKKKKKKYNWMTLLGIEESQVTPVWPHKSFERSQFKLPFDVNEL